MPSPACHYTSTCIFQGLTCLLAISWLLQALAPDSWILAQTAPQPLSLRRQQEAKKPPGPTKILLLAYHRSAQQTINLISEHKQLWHPCYKQASCKLNVLTVEWLAVVWAVKDLGS